MEIVYVYIPMRDKAKATILYSNTVTVTQILFQGSNLTLPCIYLGILCGGCKDEDKGVSALFNHCVTCGNESGLLILALSQSILEN